MGGGREERVRERRLLRYAQLILYAALLVRALAELVRAVRMAG